MNIVLTRLDRLGDLILSTPAIRALRRSFPAARISLVCSSRNQVAVEANPDLDAIYVADTRSERKKLERQFHGVELAIALAPQMPDLQFVAATRAQRRIGYTYARRYATRLYTKLTLTDALVSSADPALCDAQPQRTVRHEVEQLLLLAARAGADVASPQIVISLRPHDRAHVSRFPLGAIHVHLAPRWLSTGSTEANFQALLRELRVCGRPLVVSYAAECEAVAGRLKAAGLADAVVGDLSFSAWAALIERAACVITVDTSATHVASAMKRPTVVLFEHQYFALNSREWAPWGVPAAVIRKPAFETEQSLAQLRQELVAAVGTLVPA